MDNKVLDIIIELINGAKDKENSIIFKTNDKFYAIRNSYYLLCQTIRNIHVDITHYYISEEAKKLWISITDDSIMKYWYRDIVKVEKECNVVIKKYKGNSNTPFYEGAITLGDKFNYRDVFQDEHIIAISNIVDELLKLQEPNYYNVSDILDKIYICRMLKSEDRRIKGKINRGLDLDIAVNNFYKPCGINIIQLKAWDEKF